MPEIEIANEIERSSLLTMHNMRGYGLSFKSNYRQEAQRYITQLRSPLNEAKELARAYAGLVKLTEGIGVAESEFNEYTT